MAWTRWEDRLPGPPLAEPLGIDRVRYCPVCDRDTLWTNEADGGPVLACECGFSLLTDLADVAPEVAGRVDDIAFTI